MAGTLQTVLDTFRAIRGVDLAAIIGIDGLVIESAAAPGLDVDAVAALAVNGLLLADALGREIGRGGAVQTMLEYEEGLLLIEPIGEDACLLVLSRARTDLGHLRFTARRYRADLAAALAAR